MKLYNWYIAILIEYFDYQRAGKSHNNRMCYVSENYCIFRARSPEEAYKKAISQGKASDGIEGVDQFGKKGRWRFAGLSGMLPIYEKLEDGAEILWCDCGFKTFKNVIHKVKRKNALQLFCKIHNSQNIRRRTKRIHV